ncbi:hypothetical protein [Nitrospirillum viridazoti]|uniref:Uncharacterized protein n=1 Tax=Nitrospirillum amazonense TaxID=28077 RepID=A0A560IKU6_9PROT|nr:hypothetical protein [Nitrospirillum amazonense]TWB58679.1 hypothetical protein FBZ92_109172 [Nitrospirillum amazonense]
MDQRTITLGGREFDVTAFDLDQLQLMTQRFKDLAKPLDEGGMDALRAIISAAIKGQIEPQELAALKTNLIELELAVHAIADTSGLTALGEARRGMEATLTGTGSTPASASAAAGTGQPSAA